MRFILIVFCLFANVGLEAPPKPTINLSKDKEYHFSRVYEHIRSHEGNYVNHKNDKGGQTYGGIARRFHPHWFGWKYVDEAQPLQRYDYVPSAEFWVKDFYLSIWVSEGFENIKNYNLALNLFDFRIHSSPRTVQLFTNRVLTKMGCESVQLGPDWIDDRFNQVDPTEFALRLKIQRLILFNHIVTNHPDQKVFYRGWVNRLESI